MPVIAVIQKADFDPKNCIKKKKIEGKETEFLICFLVIGK